MADRLGAASFRRPLSVAVIVIAGLAAACGGSGATPPPSTAPAPSLAPTPSPSPDRHILGPLDTNRVFQLLVGAGRAIHQESLGGPGPKGQPAVILYLVDGPVHVAIRQYTTPAAVAAAGFKAKSTIAKGDAPYELWASNIVLDIGPSAKGVKPVAPDTDVAATAAALAEILGPYIGPFQQRSVAPLALPSVPASATPVPPSPGSS